MAVGSARSWVLVVDQVGLNVCGSRLAVTGMMELVHLWGLELVLAGPGLGWGIPLRRSDLCWCQAGMTPDAMWMRLCLCYCLPDVL